MPEHALIMLNMPEYAWVNSCEYARILNVSGAVHSIRSLCKLLNSYQAEVYSEHCQIFQMKRSAKRIMPECDWICINIPEYS